jgi:hypothetical protein
VFSLIAVYRAVEPLLYSAVAQTPEMNACGGSYVRPQGIEFLEMCTKDMAM